MSTVEYIRSIRLKKAALLFQNGNFSVAEVMYMVGFPMLLTSPVASWQNLARHRWST